MSCDLELIIADSREEFDGLEGEVASCDVIHVGNYPEAAAFHAAARELLETGLAPTVNYYWDPATGQETFSLCYFIP